MTLVDSHCHLDDEQFQGDFDAVIERARQAGVQTLVSIGTGSGPPDLEAGLRIAAKIPDCYATIGVHPHDAAKADETTLPALTRLARDTRVVAIGEIGLDYHYNFSPPPVQRRLFAEQLALAIQCRKPIVIHTREAWADTVAVVRESGARSGIFHCFSGGPDQAEEALALGFHLSFAGIVTFPKATLVHESARHTPIERLLIETDSPYLAPVPFRGKRNEPAHLAHTARRIAELRGIPIDELASATTANWRKLCLQGTQPNG